MCENHRHLGNKTTTSYAGRNFSQELESQNAQLKKLSEKKDKIVKDLSEEIAYLFTQNNDLRQQLGQPLVDELDVESSEEALLEKIKTLRAENMSLTGQLPKEEDKKTVSENDVDAVDRVESPDIEQEENLAVAEEPVVDETPAKKKFWNFLKRK